MKQRWLAWIVLGVIALVFSACIKQPEEESGDDEIRPKAKALKMEKWVPGEVSWKKGDRTDWVVAEVKKDGWLKLEINFNRSDTSVIATLTDEFGRKLKQVNANKGKYFKWHFKAVKGKYFIQIQAENESDATEYTVRASVKEKKEEKTILRPE